VGVFESSCEVEERRDWMEKAEDSRWGIAFSAWARARILLYVRVTDREMVQEVEAYITVEYPYNLIQNQSLGSR
jgi:hypothetical protein